MVAELVEEALVDLARQCPPFLVAHALDTLLVRLGLADRWAFFDSGTPLSPQTARRLA